MIVASTRLGRQWEVAETDIIHFPQGLPGFADEKKFILLPGEPDSPFVFLQSVAEPDLTFIVVDPFAFFKDYEFSLDDRIVAELKLSDKNLPQIFNIVTIPDKAELMTANLLAPVIINPVQRVGQQIVLEKVDYTTRHRLFPNGFPQAETKGGR
ncbi:flagellar assembly protein FliW|uniref:Flagellar assembly factor FliW n=1 Tax=Dendrosporobacter quercicolus TaxID=146817 RepID=A0A1G9WU75_9FIRM|nr:flagellar assembly protein FliW [Dendrosporobacter quercicolus]NSL49213.1 flagellar assembly protein FliW [Dendrosporobacter quercicolus DSM 1736]SDM87967.1 flagellar assembly factor FliW [Dendrosporobacter quercicolus]